jgi:hypothetical protein
MYKKLYYRHLCKTFDFQITENYYSLPMNIIEHQIASGKGFYAYMPVVNPSFRVDEQNSVQNCLMI